MSWNEKDVHIKLDLIKSHLELLDNKFCLFEVSLEKTQEDIKIIRDFIRRLEK